MMNDTGFPTTREMLIGLGLSPLLLVLVLVLDLVAG